MRYAIHAADSPDGRLHANELLTQRLVSPDGEERVDDADEVLYVLDGEGALESAGALHPLRPGSSAFVAAGTTWKASGVRALSVLVHDPLRPRRPSPCVDLTAEEQRLARLPGASSCSARRPTSAASP